MGRAFHKKQIPLGRGSKTRGIGIGYMKPARPRVRELTAEEIANREKNVTPRGVREWNIHCLMHRAGFVLDAWEDPILAKNNLERDFALDAVIVRAMAIVNTAVTKCCDSSGVDVDRLLETLNRRSATANNADLASALNFVRERLVSVFEKVNAVNRQSQHGVSLAVGSNRSSSSAEPHHSSIADRGRHTLGEK